MISFACQKCFESPSAEEQLRLTKTRKLFALEFKIFSRRTLECIGVYVVINYWSLILRVTLINLLSKLILIMNYNRVLGRLGSLKVSFLCQWDHILTLMSNASSSTLIPFWSWDLINNLMNMEGPSKNEDWWHRPKKKHQ